jgi:hypothetical protein
MASKGDDRALGLQILTNQLWLKLLLLRVDVRPGEPALKVIHSVRRVFLRWVIHFIDIVSRFRINCTVSFKIGRRKDGHA